MPIQFNSNPGTKPGLVIYLTVGDPDLATSRDVALAAIDAGAEVLELGVPFSDPVADGPIIQRASERSLVRGTTLQDVLALAAELRALRPSAGLIIFTYFNPILRFGLGRFCDHAANAGVDGVLVTDMIVEEAGEYLKEMHHYGLKPIFLAAPTSTDQRLKMIAGASEGFVYAISRVGITGNQQNLAVDASRLVERLRQFTQLPIAVGFGISTAEHVAAVGEFADAAVLGTSIVSLIGKAEPGTAPAKISVFLKGLRQSLAISA
jgi:tryptophan synthase alpha chain